MSNLVTERDKAKADIEAADAAKAEATKRLNDIELDIICVAYQHDKENGQPFMFQGRCFRLVQKGLDTGRYTDYMICDVPLEDITPDESTTPAATDADEQEG